MKIHAPYHLLVFAKCQSKPLRWRWRRNNVPSFGRGKPKRLDRISKSLESQRAERLRAE
jgi:hypothetical protein